MKTLSFNSNLIASLLCIPYIFIMAFYMPNNETFLIDEITKDMAVGYVVFIQAILLGIGIPIWMYTFRFLYNRVIPVLYGIREINLSESYALSLLICIVLVH